MLTTPSDDAARLSSKVRSELPGREKEVKTEAKVLGEQAAVKYDEAVRILVPKTRTGPWLTSNTGRSSKGKGWRVRRQGTGLHCRRREEPGQVQERSRQGTQLCSGQVRQDGRGCCCED